MKVTGIIGSPRGKNSSTLRLMEAAIEGACQEGADTEIIDATRLRIGFCKGCGACYRRGRCEQDDDFSYVMEKMLKADGLILGSPSYMDGVTGQMKTLMDRMSDAIHCQQFSGKHGMAVCTTGSSGAELVADYMNKFLVSCGATVVGKAVAAIGQHPGSINDAVEQAYLLGKDLVIAIRERRTYPEQEAVHRRNREVFGESIKANKEKWAHDYLYWVQKGWV
ncbi:flavodoxin family protein [Methanocella arvoryzae]|uniref:4Fe-4S ferredoxin-domain protein (NADPH-dependent FMN reductase family) n=1 Tax=Methanocella arvoryzae (strain DSM 22066 / NBRC 105507 / MRE50) TaxID=351160 RepID=Q0W5J7_METAR|nr:flavodoxin family protein [Methanocella arvoryzae]CAJ36346.1 4Fe-4S ferredoxin-domain protein (NADPH-dependent FMN reductase family) [Methanocella arvoryzae MRE50]